MKNLFFCLFLAVCFICYPSYCISSEEDSSSNEAYEVYVESNEDEDNPEFSSSSNEIEQGIIDDRNNENNADETFFDDEDIKADEGSPFEESR
ncbi:MAG: hypothetical protein PHQ52_01640 [Candidatus Omnitrophica bacterium]|nr:hypothetical protein [Candidatus Omnitrophota bacterium]